MGAEQTHTVGRLARRFGLSRSTLLYYDSIGLLSPSFHRPGEYRRYDEQDVRRLEKIMSYRRAGLRLEKIRQILDTRPTRLRQALESRLGELSDEIGSIREQQRFILELLGGGELPEGDGTLDRSRWADVAQSAGLSEDELRRWHREFERRAPERHRRFLHNLRMPDDEIETIRTWSRAPQVAARIRKMSTRQIELLLELFTDTPRQGPGSSETTQRALDLLPELPPTPNVLEVGCGTGGSTLALARHTGGTVTATDFHQPFLDVLEQSAREAGVPGIMTRCQDMAELALPAGSVDLIWAESCVFIMGFEAAVTSWKPMLAPRGVMVISDVSWLTDAPDDEIREFWEVGYPGMSTVSHHREVIEREGFELLAHFTQPVSDWDVMYGPIRETRLPLLAERHPDDPQAQELVRATRQEMGLYERFSHQYGQEFYVFRKR